MNETVLYIGGFELPDKNAAAHRVLANAKILKDLGKDVVFIGVNKELNHNSEIEDTYLEVQGFKSYSVPYPSKVKDWIGYLSNIDGYRNIISKIGSVGLVVCYNFPSVALSKIYKYCSKNNILCIADVTEWYSVADRNIVFKMIKGFDTWYRMRIVHKRLNGLIVISKFLEQYYQKSKFVYIPTLTDLNEVKWGNNYRRSDTCLNLVYAGNPGRKDRIDILIEALTKVKRDYALDIVGITKEQYIKMYPQHKAFLAGTKKVVFHGRLKHLETLEYIKKANYSCFFRENDRVSKAGFPTKLAEAISCGTPVITNESSNIKDYMVEHKNGVCIKSLNEKDVEEVLNGIEFQMPVEKEEFMYKQYEESMKKFLRKIGISA